MNTQQCIANDILDNSLTKAPDEQLLMIVMGGTGTGKSHIIGALMKVVVESLGNDSMLGLGTTGTVAFEIAGATCYSMLDLPINQPINQLSALVL